MSNTGENGQIILKIVANSFTPNGHGVSAYITKKFKERQCASGYTWKYVDQEMKDFYYKEFLKTYTWEPGHEVEFKETWNLYCRNRYKALLYKWRNKKTRPFHVPDEIWDAWKEKWAEEQWQRNSAAARNNINSDLTGKHIGGSRSTIEHAILMEDTLQRPPDSWELFRTTHQRKDGSFVDLRAQAIDAQMVERLSQASQESIEGGESHTPTHDDINKLYYEVVGGSKKNSLYGLGSHAKVLFDLSTPRLKGGSSFTSTQVEALRKENEELRHEFGVLRQNIEDQVNEKVEERALVLNQNMEERVQELKQNMEDQFNETMDARVNAVVRQQMKAFIDRFMPSQPLMSPSCFPTPHGFASQETQDPNANDE